MNALEAALLEIHVPTVIERVVHVEVDHDEWCDLCGDAGCSACEEGERTMVRPIRRDKRLERARALAATLDRATAAEVVRDHERILSIRRLIAAQRRRHPDLADHESLLVTQYRRNEAETIAAARSKTLVRAAPVPHGRATPLLRGLPPVGRQCR